MKSERELAQKQGQILSSLKAMGLTDLDPKRIIQLSTEYRTVDDAVCAYVDECLVSANNSAVASKTLPSAPVIEPRPRIDAKLTSVSSRRVPEDVLTRGMLHATLAAEAPRFNCPICMSDFSVNESYIANCRFNHRCCHQCTFQIVRNALVPTDTNQPHIPTCPMANQGSADSACNHLFELEEVKQILNIAYDFGELTIQQLREFESNIDSLYFDKANRELGHVRCAKCSAWFSLPDNQIIGEVRLIKCNNSNCLIEFCSGCNQTPYHYRQANIKSRFKV